MNAPQRPPPPVFLALDSRQAAVKKQVLAEQAELLAQLEPLPGARWRESGGDPLKVLDVARANRRLDRGVDAVDCALHIAVARAIREHGWNIVFHALQGVQS